MNGILSHRGPDGDGVFKNDDVGLGHRRLSIIDIDGGSQPMEASDGRFVTVINGEIYNYKELRAELSSKGSVFKSMSDTEVVAECVRHFGVEKAFSKLRGMFAFAIYDKEERTLMLGRDRVGIKPLYYSQIGDALFFASEQKSLLEVPEVSRKIEMEGVCDFLTLGYPVGELTCWKDIKMFPPGHYAVLKKGERLQPRRYWQWEWRPEKMDFEEALQMTGEILTRSLKYHLIADVPVAAFLSGGIDSSLLVYFMTKGGNLIDNLKTFNVGFEEEGYNESTDAEHVAKICGTEHHSLLMRGDEASPEIFEKILSQYDEPYGDSSCLPTYLICKEMSKHAKTVISGDGGDEMFGGYHRYHEIEMLQRAGRIPMKGLLARLVPLFLPVLGENGARRVSKGLRCAMMPRERLFCELHTYFQEEEKQRVLTDDVLAKTGGFEPSWRKFARFMPEKKGSNISEELMGLEVMTHLHGDYLRKVDVASSAHGLEVRVPFLDNEVMELSSRLPLEFKLKDGECKRILREITRRKLSERAGNKRKQGFGIPFDRWSGGTMAGYLEDLLLGERASRGLHRIVRKDAVRTLWEGFAGRDTSRRELSRYQVYQRVFMLASVQIWFDKHRPEF